MSERQDGNAPQSLGTVGSVTERVRDLVQRARNEVFLPWRRSTYARAEGRPLYARLLFGLAIPVCFLWVALAAGLNIFVPQLERVVELNTLSFLPDDAPSVQALSNMSKHFGHGGSNNAVAVLLEGQSPLGDESRRYYRDLVAKFDADKKHVVGLIDVWLNPPLAPAAESADKKASFLYLYLSGNIGSAEGMQSTRVVRDIIASSPPPAGVKVYLTGPAAVVNDELVAINQSTMRVILACALLVTLIMFVTYRSPITGGGPLIVVVIALLSARQIVALLSGHQIIGVSGFASSLLAGVVLGAGTNYGIFLLGRYQEARRAGEDPTTAYYTALTGVQHVVVASGLTVASATACLAFTRLAIFSSSGLPCTIGVLTTLAAALTLGPAMLALASRFGLYEPRGQYSTRRWRRIATRVVRWPGPVLAASIAVLAVATLALPAYVVSYDERAAQPRNTEANLGLVAADRHLPPDILNPSLLFVESDHDMRNPADLIALAKLTNAVFSVDGVRAVQGITRPLIAPLPQGTLTYQAGYIGERIIQTTKVASARLQQVAALSDRIGQLSTVVQGLQSALDTAQGGFDRSIHSGQDLQKQLVDVVTKARSIRDDAQPLTQSADQLLNTIPNCSAIQYCSAAATGLSLLDNLNQFDEHKFQDLLDGVQVASSSLPQLGAQIHTLGAFLDDMQQTLAPLRGLLEGLGPQVAEIAEFSKEVADSFSSGDPSASFFIPSQAFKSPLFKSALPYFFSPDGKITRIVVMGEMNAFSRESMDYTARWSRLSTAEPVVEHRLTPTTPLVARAGSLVPRTGAGRASASSGTTGIV